MKHHKQIETKSPTKTPLTEEEILAEIRDRVAASSQRQVALAADLTRQQLNQVLRGWKSISPVMAYKLGFEVRYVRRAGVRA